MNSCTNKSRIISLYGFFILMQVLETKGASRHMHLISEKHLTEELKRLNLRRRSWGQKALARGKRTRRRLLLKNMPQCWHSSCHEESGMIRVVGELNCSRPHIRLREPSKSEDKVESTDHKKRDADVRRRIVGPWAWLLGTQREHHMRSGNQNKTGFPRRSNRRAKDGVTRKPQKPKKPHHVRDYFT
ncbi:hypothetical protein BHM03_00009942 [Ensete ventricosum]|nr:hypothetical protein BHM03_00009942 [Ensete ventricosum]